MWCLGDVADLSARVVRGICCLLFSGPALIIAGVIVIVTSNINTREDAIVKYNRAVDEWPAQRSLFGNRTFLLYAGAVGSNNSTASPFSAANGGDKLNDDDPTLKKYDQLRWEASYAVAGVASIKIQNVEDAWESVLKLPASAVEKYSKGELNCETSQKNSKSCPAACSDRGGSYSTFDKECSVTVYLQSACVRLTSGLVLDTSRGSEPGCFSSNSFKVGKYSKSPIVSSVTVQLRVAGDPYLVADEITFGTFWFGLSLAQRLGVGFALVGVGAAVSAAVLCSLKWIIAYYRKRSPNGGAQGVVYVQPQAPPPPQQVVVVNSDAFLGQNRYAQQQQQQQPLLAQSPPGYSPGYSPGYAPGYAPSYAPPPQGQIYPQQYPQSPQYPQQYPK